MAPVKMKFVVSHFLEKLSRKIAAVVYLNED
jgi:hypothetical protein